MKKIITSAQITSISAKVDGSIRLGLNTPELTPEEKVEIMKLQNLNIEATFIPSEEHIVEELRVKGKMEIKSQGQRIRAIIFLLWKQSDQTQSFEEYYFQKTEKIIDFLKQKLN